MQAADPQAVLSSPIETAMFLVLTVDAGAEDRFRDLLADVRGLKRATGFRHPVGELSCVVELGSELWDRLFGDPRPAGLHGFKSFDERDLLGFVDGTENPEGTAARTAVTIGDEDPEFAGGSYVVVQKYVHDLGAWDALPIEAQERAIGRTKLGNIEMPDDVKPSNSHVALTTIVDKAGE